MEIAENPRVIPINSEPENEIVFEDNEYEPDIELFNDHKDE